MRIKILILFCVFSSNIWSQSNHKIIPDGLYVLNNKLKNKADGVIYGYSGEIKIVH
jgi:hypothetical protein